MIVPAHISNQVIFYLTLLLAIATTMSIGLTNILFALILLIFLLKKDLFSSLNAMRHNMLAVAGLLYFIVYLFGLFYPSYIGFNNGYFHQAMPILVLPILLITLQQQHTKPVLLAYLLGATVSVLFSYAIILGLTTSIFQSGQYSYFTNRLDHAPQMAFAFFITLTMLLFWNLTRVQKIATAILMLLFLGNIFVTDGRSGQLSFVVVMLLFIVWYFKTKKKYLLLAAASFMLFLFSMYHLSETFAKRVDATAYETLHYDTVLNTSVGLRIHMIIDSLRLAKRHPLLGTGTGSYGHENVKLRKELGKVMQNHGHPHNQYLLSLVQHGIVGLLSLLFIYFAMFRYTFVNKTQDEHNFLRIALPVLFMVVTLSDVYLTHTLTFGLFIVISGVLYAHQKPA